MSTKIKTLKGKIEIIENDEIVHKDVEITLIRFWGGMNSKQSLQISCEGDYFQLDSEEIKKLKQVLNTEFE